MQQRQVTYLPIDQISPNPFQPRDKMIDDDKFKELVSSVLEHGILEPLVVADTPAGYQLIAGERRWRAAKKAGIADAPVHLIKTTPKGMLEMALVENIQRVDLTPLDRAQALSRLKTDFNYTITDISTKIGRDHSYVSNSIRLLALPDPIKDGLNVGKITEAHARAFLSMENEKDMLACYRFVLKTGASSRRTEDLVRSFTRKGASKASIQAAIIGSDQLQERWNEKIRDVLQKNTSIKLSRTNRSTRVTIVLKGNPEMTQDALDKLSDLMGVEKALPEGEVPPIATVVL